MSTRNEPDRSGRRESVWLATTPTTDYGALDGELEVDTAVVGGGIAGVTTAAKLRDAGQSVALIERGRILAGVTGHTTAKLTSLHGLPYKHLTEYFGLREAQLYAEANEAAIDDVEETVGEHDVDCDFTRRPVYTYVEEPGRRSRVREEVDAARRAGLDATYEESTELPYPVAAAVALEDQATFHPRAYLLALARRIPGDEGYVFEETTVVDVDDATPCRVETDRGVLLASDIVVASHFPVVDRAMYFSRLHPRRSYVLVARVREDPPRGMYYRAGEPYFSVRPLSLEGDQFVMFGGENHRTGRGEPAERYRALERTVRERFDVEAVEYRWSTQDYVSPDGVPFVGELAPRTDHLYVATGFGGWGMTGGTAAGLLLCDLVLGRENEWRGLFDPSRLKLRASVGSLASHNAAAMRKFAERFTSRGRSFDATTLQPGEADLFDVDGETVAVYRESEETLHAVSGTCTHMGCRLSWNDAERSWDCACHGSRFDVDGSVLDTPAVENLKQYDLQDATVQNATGSGGRGDESDDGSPGGK